jgi:hypothetical protein
MRRSGLRDDQWQRIKDMLPGARGLGRGDGGGQSVVPRSGALSLSYRDAMASRCREHHDRKTVHYSLGALVPTSWTGWRDIQVRR